MYYMIDECPICLEELDFSNNIIITLECCKKDVHLDCIKKWSTDINNKNKDYVYYVEKISFLQDLYNNFNLQPSIDNSNSEVHYIQIRETYDINTELMRRARNKNFMVTTVLIIYLIIGIIMFIIIDNISSTR